MSIPEPAIRFVTENAIMLQFDESQLNDTDHQLQRRLCQLAEQLRSHEASASLIQEAVPAPASLLLVLHNGHSARRVVRLAESLWDTLETLPPASHIVEIPVIYDGPDLQAVAAHTGMSQADVIHLHSQPLYFVQCLGFLPGFPYLSGLDFRLSMPRKHNPAMRVAAGSVAIGGTSTGIYPADSPGGWHIIGRTDARLFNPDGQPETLLMPGDQVRFIIIEGGIQR
jgi:5-oxoprolinase (ATP-hydrolysing) subunit B